MRAGSFADWWVSMYIPRHYHQVFPVLTSLLGFYLAHNLQPTYDVVGVFITLQILAVSHSGWIILLSYPYQRYITWVNTPDEPKIPTIEPPDPQGWKPLPNLNVSQQVVAPVKFDMERQFAKTLLVMRDYTPHDAAVDLREKTWIRPNKFKTRDEYVNMLHAWVNHGVISRKSTAKNSPYVVRRWDAVELIADGNPIR